MQTASPERDERVRASSPALGLGFIAALAAFVWVVGLGGTAVGELSPTVTAINALVVAPLLVTYLLHAPRQADRVDRLVLFSLLLFTVTCLFSQFLRQSFEAAVAAASYCAAFFVARSLLARSTARDALVWTLIGLSAALTVLTAARWGVYLLDWMALVEWRTTPPLNMELPSIPWGHRHDLSLLLAMLYPAWWVGHPSRLRKVLAVTVGVGVAAVVLIDGSRMLWLAILAASVLTGLATMRRRAGSKYAIGLYPRAALAGGILVALALLAVSGVGGILIERIANFESLGWRTAMWSALVEWWIDHPIAGGGPGSFPWLLQGTAYFDTTSFAPRHPDSAPIQLLAEGGLLGMAAMMFILVAVLPQLLAGKSLPAVWALLAFAVASIGSNPTDFAFLVVVAIVWTAYAIPHSAAPVARAEASRSSLVVRGVTVAGAVAVSAAWLLTVVGSATYHDARAAITNGSPAPAGQALDAAMTLDPGMGIYARQSGTLELVQGEATAALEDLSAATMLNPHDDLAWRTLALAARASGDASLAEHALAAALDLQRSDPANLLLAAEWQATEGHSEDARNLLAEAVQAWPELVFAPGWDVIVAGAGLTTDDVVDQAATRWLSGLSGPEMVSDQGIWLAVLAGRDDAVAEALRESGYSHHIGIAMVSLLRCEAATAILDAAPPGDLRSSVYWQLRIRDAAVTNAVEGPAREVVELMTRQRLEDRAGPLNPLREGSVRGTSTDLWGYRRATIAWPSIDFLLPAPAAGLVNWTNGVDCDVSTDSSPSASENPPDRSGALRPRHSHVLSHATHRSTWWTCWI